MPVLVIAEHDNSKLKIDILGKMHDATILDESPYDPENKLLRA